MVRFWVLPSGANQDCKVNPFRSSKHLTDRRRSPVEDANLFIMIDARNVRSIRLMARQMCCTTDPATKTELNGAPARCSMGIFAVAANFTIDKFY
jgi:hypothetical protein